MNSFNNFLKFFILVNFLFLSLISQAHKVSVSKNEGRIFLSANSCDVLLEEQEQLGKWKIRMEGKGGSSHNKKCKKTSEDQFSLDVTANIPKIALETQGIGNSFAGPNCWNTSLVSNKILPEKRFTSQNEFKFWLNSPLCRKIEESEVIQSGDIIAIREYTDWGTSEVHGLTYISEQISFSKNGFERGEKYLLMSTEEVFEKFKVSKDCRTSESDCERWSETYRCQPLSHFLNENDYAVKKDYQKIENSLRSIEYQFGLDSLIGVNRKVKELNAIGEKLDDFDVIISTKLSELPKITLTRGEDDFFAKAFDDSDREVFIDVTLWEGLGERVESLRSNLIYYPSKGIEFFKKRGLPIPSSLIPFLD